MHLALAVCTIAAAWKWGDWRNWRKYHATLLYILAVGMMHEFLTSEYEVWTFQPEIFLPGKLVVLLYAVVTVPASILIYLSTFPESSWSKKIIHIGIWVAIYMGVETLEFLTGRITYAHGWDLLDSFIFDLIMFPMLRLHQKRPLLAYLLSTICIAAYLVLYKVPIRS